REKFRPFAPSILEESVGEYFVNPAPDPFMQQVYPVRDEKREVLPAITHVDGSGRLQTVSARTNSLYYRLIKEFARLTGVPVLLAPGDIVRIAVWRNAELSGEFVIGPDGSITHPLYREVKAAGVPVAEVERRVAVFLARYGEANPAFTVTALIRIFVGGEVRS